MNTQLLGRCCSCESWDKEIPEGKNQQRYCNHPKLMGNESYDSDGAGADDGYGRIETGPEFGCVHYTKA